MSHRLRIRGVSERLAEGLADLARRRGLSLNATVLELLEHAVGVTAREEGLRRHATAEASEVDELDGLIREQRRIDDELWT